ncbi:hypothetical protein LEP1GSC199_3601 [Leptospira vanthielii serovar Holland str. Waz Holland = ATCC 700522]|uniref:Uncharacterized protein n=1 Tax=Leptospira vanthielii serovar Holland str. Waz Holland = ATCC 700522 TaxID=1218591 RepID=N1WDN5_9LEPT|nr:hypothetical protein LEP1GSC199_3601 [Leptospira vanthielii serovar Holland str. Waz Holland = ATCC 700522]
MWLQVKFHFDRNEDPNYFYNRITYPKIKILLKNNPYLSPLEWLGVLVLKLLPTKSP